MLDEFLHQNLQMEDDESTRFARMEYLRGKHTSEEFLRKIDTTHGLERCETSKVKLVAETVWQKRAASGLTFDPEH